MKAYLQKKLSQKAVKYIVVGISGFAAEYLVFIICYRYSNISVVPANILSFLAGLTISFSGQRFWTFYHKQKNYTKRATHQIILFLALSAFNLLLSTGLIDLLTRKGINPLAGKVCVQVVVAVWNYLIFNRIIFFAVQKKEPEV